MRYEPNWMSDQEVYEMLVESRDESTADNWLECLDGLRNDNRVLQRVRAANEYLEQEQLFIRVVDVKVKNEDDFYWNVLFIDQQ